MPESQLPVMVVTPSLLNPCDLSHSGTFGGNLWTRPRWHQASQNWQRSRVIIQTSCIDLRVLVGHVHFGCQANRVVFGGAKARFVSGHPLG